MRILTIQHQKYHILTKIKMKGQSFKLKDLIDFGSNLNIVNKEIIPSIYEVHTNHFSIGKGNKLMQMDYEVPKATLCFDHYCLDMKFLLAYIRVGFI